MCFYPKYRLPVPIHALRFEHRFGYGWSNKSKAFIFDKRDTDRLNYLLLPHYYGKYKDDLQEIPCGQCMACRVSKTRDLAQRALAESTMHEGNYFITLTYDNEHLRHTMINTLSRIDGTLGLHPELKKRDWQLFAKNFRKYHDVNYNKKIKLFPCGEYGPKNGRPHFHAIAYGCILNDLKFFKVEDGYVYYTSETVSNAWRDYEHSVLKDKSDALPRGFVLLTEVTWETCAYVAGYITKKSIGKSEKEYVALCEELGVKPMQREYHESGRRPGLGLDYYEANKDKIYSFDCVTLPGGKSFRPCKYYDSKFDIDEPELMEQIKERRLFNRNLALSQEYKAAGLTDEKQILQYEKQKIDVFTARHENRRNLIRDNM